jgi:hypothetical protein
VRPRRLERPQESCRWSLSTTTLDQTPRIVCQRPQLPVWYDYVRQVAHVVIDDWVELLSRPENNHAVVLLPTLSRARFASSGSASR